MYSKVLPTILSNLNMTQCNSSGEKKKKEEEEEEENRKGKKNELFWIHLNSANQ